VNGVPDLVGTLPIASGLASGAGRGVGSAPGSGARVGSMVHVPPARVPGQAARIGHTPTRVCAGEPRQLRSENRRTCGAPSDSRYLAWFPPRSIAHRKSAASVRPGSSGPRPGSPPDADALAVPVGPAATLPPNRARLLHPWGCRVVPVETQLNGLKRELRSAAVYRAGSYQLLCLCADPGRRNRRTSGLLTFRCQVPTHAYPAGELTAESPRSGKSAYRNRTI
jgi:hypothetical protein